MNLLPFSNRMEAFSRFCMMEADSLSLACSVPFTRRAMFSLGELTVGVLIQSYLALVLVPGFVTLSWLLLVALLTTVGLVHCSFAYTDVYEYLRVSSDDPPPTRKRRRRRANSHTGDFVWPTRQQDLLLRSRCTLCALLTLEAVRVPLRAFVLGWPYLLVCCGWPQAPLGRSFFALSLYPVWFFDMIELLGCTGAYLPPSVRLSKWWRTPSRGDSRAPQSACFPSKYEEEIEDEDKDEEQGKEEDKEKEQELASFLHFMSPH